MNTETIARLAAQYVYYRHSIQAYGPSPHLDGVRQGIVQAIVVGCGGVFYGRGFSVAEADLFVALDAIEYTGQLRLTDDQAKALRKTVRQALKSSTGPA